MEPVLSNPPNMYEVPIVDALHRYGTEQAKHSMGFNALAVLDREVKAVYEKAGRLLRILEIGTFRAYSTVVLAQYGVVYAVDICDQRETQEIINLSENKERIIRLIGYDQPAVRSLLSGITHYDIVYVDGDHSGEGVACDCAFVRGLSNLYFFHDYQEKYVGCRKAIDAFVEATGGVFNVWGSTSGLCRVVIGEGG